MEIRETRFDHPDAIRLNDMVQLEYDERYGDGGDRSHIAADHFLAPDGRYVLGYDGDGKPVASGGWRAQDDTAEGFEAGDAEIKRMFVVREARGRGFAREVLAHLEESAAAAGRRRMVLETGQMQPEAVALYTSCGYLPVREFGYYRDAPLSIHLGKPLGGRPVTP